MGNKFEKPKGTAADAVEALESLRIETSGALQNEGEVIEFQNKLKTIENLSEDLSKLFHEKIAEHASMDITALKVLAQKNPEKFVEIAPSIMKRVQNDSVIKSKIAECESINPGMGAMVSNYFAGVGDYLESKATLIKSRVADYAKDVVNDFSEIKKEDVTAIDYQNALTVGSLTAFWPFIYEGDFSTTFKTFGFAAAVGANSAVAKAALKTINAGLEGVGYISAEVLTLCTDFSHSVASGDLLGLNEKQRQEAMEVFETIEAGIQHFPPRMKGIWQKVLVEKNGKKAETGKEINDDDISYAAYFAVRSLSESMGQLEFLQFNLDVKKGKLEASTFRRYLLTTSSGGLVAFFRGHPAYAAKFDKQLEIAKGELEAGTIKTFTAEELENNPNLFRFATPPNVSQEKLRGIAGDFKLGASGMLVKYLMIAWGISFAAAKIIGAGSWIFGEGRKSDVPELKNKTILEGEKTLSSVLKKDYSLENWKIAVGALGSIGFLKKTFLFSNENEVKKLKNIKDKEAIFNAIKSKGENNWVVPTTLTGFRDKQNELWATIGTVGKNARVKLPLGKFKTGLDSDSDKKELLKDNIGQAYLNLNDLIEMYKELEKNGKTSLSDFSTDMSLWKILKNPIKFSWRNAKNISRESRKNIKDIAVRIRSRFKSGSKRNFIKNGWNGPQGFMLGNMQVLGVPKFMLGNLKKTSKAQRASAVLTMAKEVRDLYGKRTKS
ncbi:hypothetical protein KAI58_00645 [Candidatus Gracilibacteria bacterium]|nr:hypothetical protein [Candidatus Gracilibacteria bacterium]